MHIADWAPCLNPHLVWIIVAMLGTTFFSVIPAGPHRVGGRV